MTADPLFFILSSPVVSLLTIVHLICLCANASANGVDCGQMFPVVDAVSEYTSNCCPTMISFPPGDEMFRIVMWYSHPSTVKYS